jgi:hypothetical protein
MYLFFLSLPPQERKGESIDWITELNYVRRLEVQNKSRVRTSGKTLNGLEPFRYIIFGIHSAKTSMAAGY